MATPTFTSPTPTCIFLAAISAYSCVCQIGISNLLCPKLSSCSIPTNPASLMDFSISVNDHSILLVLQAKIWNHSLSHTTHPGIQQSLLILPSKYILNPTTSHGFHCYHLVKATGVSLSNYRNMYLPYCVFLVPFLPLYYILKEQLG